MAQKKAHEVDRWLARPDPDVSIVLVYGPDRGLVSERAWSFARRTGLSLDDPFAVIRLDAGEIEPDPGRLLDEANTVSMFGGNRLIWIRNAGAHKGFAEAVKALAASPPSETAVLVEAGDLKKTAALRTVVEAAGSAMALPCYPDEARAIDELIDEVLAKEGLAIGLDARRMLKRNLGGDRLASRGEIEKLALYCGGKTMIDEADVTASVGDASGVTADHVGDALLAGDMQRTDEAFSRVASAGGSPQQVLAGALRQFQTLQALRNVVDQERRSPAAAVAAARPPIFFARRKAFETALAGLDAATLGRILLRLQDAVLGSRQRPELAFAIIRQAMMAVASELARSTRSRAG